MAFAETAQKKLESDYPKLFVSNEDITEKRNQARKALKENPEFKKLVEARGNAYRATAGLSLRKRRKTCPTQEVA